MPFFFVVNCSLGSSKWQQDLSCKNSKHHVNLWISPLGFVSRVSGLWRARVSGVQGFPTERHEQGFPSGHPVQWYSVSFWNSEEFIKGFPQHSRLDPAVEDCVWALSEEEMHASFPGLEESNREHVRLNMARWGLDGEGLN